jgi:hypothetical protein
MRVFYPVFQVAELAAARRYTTTQLKDKGITQKAFAEQIGMNTRHLAAIKSSELRHHYFNELGATKLACLWVLEHLGKTKRR